MKTTRAFATVTATATVAVSAILLSPGPLVAAPAGTPHLPDLQTVIPLTAFSVVQGTAGKEFRYTHLVYNAGPGPLEVQPTYDDVTGGYRGMQQVFTHDAAGQWSLVSQSRVPDVFVFHAEHGHFHFPLASFGLYKVASDGGLGAPVSISPKVGFCIDDSYIYDSTVVHAGTFVGTRSSCTDPSGLRGLSVGGADEYDYRDPGQSIPFDGIADGTYWFKAVSDPNNDFVEANEANNETDVKVTISGTSVTAGEVRHPDTTPPSTTLTAPAEGGVVKGQVSLSATTPLASPAKVEFLVDGTVIGTGSGTGPYTMTWDSTTAVDGTHWLASRVTDAQGRIGTSKVVAATVSNVAPPSNSLRVAASSFSDGEGPRTATLSGLKGGNVVLALVASDGPSSPPQTASVSGGGLTWGLVKRANSRPGTSEIWKTTLPATATSVSATATPAGSGEHASLTLLAFDGASGVGASTAAAGISGAAGTTLTTTKPYSWVFGVGNDWDGAAARTLASSQTMRHQWVDSSIGDTFWSQSTAAPTASTARATVIGTTAPTDHQWNFAAVEVLEANTTSPPDTTPPTVSLTDPAAGSTVSGVVAVGATAADAVGVTSVQFLLDGAPLGAADTSPPFMTSWDTRTAAAGAHTLGARASDAAGNVGTAAPITVKVDNSAAPPATITIDGRATKQASGAITATGLTTTKAGDTVIAFVASDGPAGAGGQTTTVSGAGLTWTLVKRSNTQSGVTEIWSAKAAGVLSSASVTATPAQAGFQDALTVLAFAGANGTGVAGATGAPSGGPSIYLPGVAQGSWVFAVGNDWDRAVARTPVAGQVLQQQYVVTGVGDTFWVQSTTAPSPGMGLVTISDTAPTDDQWNYTAVEVRAATS